MDNVQSMNQAQQPEARQQNPKQNNKVGMIGFILALLGLLFCWVPGFNALFWFSGMVFSIVGICRIPRVFAAIGIGITCISIWATLYFSIMYLSVWLNIQRRNEFSEYCSEIHDRNGFADETDRAGERCVEYVEVQGKKGSVSLYLGMPKDSVRLLVGKPESVDLRTVGTIAIEEWGYKIRNQYVDDLEIEFENGRLRSVDQNDY